MRHPAVEELFQWKQAYDAGRGMAAAPFDNAETRFAVGAIQALRENNDEPSLNRWISGLLTALQDAHKTKTELAEAYGLDADLEAFAVAKAEKLPTVAERRFYLTSCWIEALCTAEVRFLGWVYQELYGRPFAA